MGRVMSADESKCAGCEVGEAVTRRAFLAMAATSAAALALAGCGGSGEGGTGPVPPGVGEINITLGDFPALVNVGATVKVRNSPPVAISRIASGSAGLVAFSLSCTHQGTTTNINDNFTITCPNHGARFNSAGVWTGGQITGSLVRLPVRVNDASGVATVTLG